MTTILYELVPPSLNGGQESVKQEALKLKDLLNSSGLVGRINSLLIPQIIPEELDRPIPLEEKIDPLDTVPILTQELAVSLMLTQVTAFTSVERLSNRLKKFRQSGVDRVVFVGVPRVFREEDAIGPAPGEAIRIFHDLIPSRGVILIPTRIDEDQRFRSKAEAGANFALTQLLFSDYITGFLKELDSLAEKPEIILSFGYVPKVELEKGLLRWLIHDTPDVVQKEVEYIADLANQSFKEKKRRLVDLYKRIADSVSGGDFPIGLHFECPYGASEPAFETFNAMLDVWTPKSG